MKCLLALLTLAGLLVAPLQAAPYDEDKPHGRVCVAVSEGGKDEVLRSTSTPGAGKTIHVFLDASDKCTAVVAPLQKNGTLANGWKPLVVDLEEDHVEVELPKAPANWEWSAAGEPFEFQILFLPPGNKESGDLRKLISAMQDPKIEARVLALQTNKLRELLGRVAAEKDRGGQIAATDPEVGGVFRGNGFPWRQYAQGVNFSPQSPGILLIPGPSAK